MMYDSVVKILKIPAYELDKINEYLSNGAIILSIDKTQTSELSSETNYFYIGLTNSSH